MAKNVHICHEMNRHFSYCYGSRKSAGNISTRTAERSLIKCTELIKSTAGVYKKRNRSVSNGTLYIRYSQCNNVSFITVAVDIFGGFYVLSGGKLIDARKDYVLFEYKLGAYFRNDRPLSLFRLFIVSVFIYYPVYWL